MEKCTDVMGVLFGGAEDEMRQYNFQAGKRYKFRLESVAPLNGGDNGIGAILEGVLATRLCFMNQQEYEEDLLSRAIEVAKGVDVVLAFVGNSSVWETEGTLLLYSSAMTTPVFSELCIYITRSRPTQHEPALFRLTRSLDHYSRRHQPKHYSYQLDRISYCHAMAR